jgi:hypothetical protein
MNLAASVPIRSAVEAFGALRRHPFLGLAILGLDVGFILFYGALAPLREQAAAAGVLSSAQGLRDLAADEQFASLLSGPHASVFSSTLGLLLILLFAGYVVLQATAWWLAHRAAGHRHAYPWFLGRFALVSLPFFAATAALVLLRFSLDFRARVIAKVVGQAQSPAIWPVVLLLAVGYFGVLATATLGIRTGWRLALTSRGFLTAALLAVALLASDFLLAQLGRLGIAGLLAGGFLVLFPLLAAAKLYLIIAGKRLLHDVRARH